MNRFVTGDFLGSVPAFILLMLAIMIAKCTPATDMPPPLHMQPTNLTFPDSSTVSYDFGYIEVPQNRQSNSDSTWRVEIVRFSRAPGASPDTPPIFILRGGPGSEAASQLLEDPSYFRYFYEPLTQISDVIIPGQRGLQTSGNTACEPIPEQSIASMLDSSNRAQAVLAGLKTCRASMEARGIDLAGLNVEEMAADVYDIAKGLGYDKIQLMGQSFGSHWGMITLRNHPDLIARATLSALEGPDHTYDTPAHIATTLARIAENAAASPELAPHMPAEGLLKAYQSLITRAEENPISVPYVDEDTGEQLTVKLDGDAFRLLARGYSRGTSWRYIMPFWPLDLLNMVNGEYEGAARRYVHVNTSRRLNDAAYYQVDCASGISTTRKQALASDAGVALVGNLHTYYDLVCQAWDADLGEAFRSAFTTDVPAVLIHGTWDTSTPYENAEEVSTFFTNHRLVRIEGGSHGAFREAREDVDGFDARINTWLATGDFSAIPEQVELPPLQWRAP